MPEKSDTLIDVKGDNRNDDYFEELRRRAENTLEHNSGADINAKDLQEAVHELQVHQIELGMQNEELVRTRDNLYEIKNKYQELFDYAPVGYFIIDTDSRVLEVNHAGVRLLGKPAKSVVGKQLTHYIRGGSLVIFNDYLNQLFSSRRPQNFEVEVRGLDGEFHWVHLFCKIFEQSGKTSETIFAAMVDITDKKEREQQLSESRQEYFDIVETANSIIAKIDMQGQITYMNRFGLEFYGYAGEDIIGKSVIGTITPEIDSEGKNCTYLLKAFLRNPKDYTDQVSENVRADGSRAWVHWRSKPIKNKDGNTDCILGVGQDITEQKKARDIIKRDNKKLELLVEERTKQLLKAQKKIEESKRLTDLGRLAATVAHELRRPFASLKLSLYNIRKKRTNSKIDTHIDRCDEKIFEGEQIINNLLKSSSLHEPELQEIDLKKILSECLTEMQKHYKGRHVRLEKKLEPLEKATLKADPLQIKEVVYNILQNSYEALFSEEGTIRVNGFIAGETAGFSITDNDEGIPKEEMEKVTEPFYTTKHRGIGLGLTIAKEIVNGHGGSLDIESKKGVETTVTVTLPKNKEK
jgi:PAS domain S-box-containing protein